MRFRSPYDFFFLKIKKDKEEEHEDIADADPGREQSFEKVEEMLNVWGPKGSSLKNIMVPWLETCYFFANIMGETSLIKNFCRGTYKGKAMLETITWEVKEYCDPN